VFDYRKLHRFAYFQKEAGLGIDFIHEENDYIDFLVQKTDSISTF
jgi:hypothetical protein